MFLFSSSVLEAVQCRKSIILNFCIFDFLINSSLIYFCFIWVFKSFVNRFLPSYWIIEGLFSSAVRYPVPDIPLSQKYLYLILFFIFINIFVLFPNISIRLRSLVPVCLYHTCCFLQCTRLGPAKNTEPGKQKAGLMLWCKNNNKQEQAAAGSELMTQKSAPFVYFTSLFFTDQTT